MNKVLINPTDKTLTIHLDDGKIVCVNIADENNDQKMLDFIDVANRQYAATAFKIRHNTDRYVDNFGCLTTKVLGIDNVPITFINPKYIINVFLNILKCMFREDEKYLRLCQRDENVIVPSSEENITQLIETMTNSLHNINLQDQEEGEEDSIIDIRDIFMVIIQQISSLQNNTNKIQKQINNGTIKKKASLIGGIPNFAPTNSLKQNFNETLKQTSHQIHNLIYLYRHYIYKTCPNEIDYVRKCIENDSDLQLYENTNISYKFMMQTIDKIFHELFLNILPKTSMLESLYAMLYHAAFLNELNLLNYYHKVIQLPLLYRIINSFYYDNNNNNNNNNNNEDQKLTRLISKLNNNNNNNDDDNINDKLDILNDIALKVNFQNNEINDNIYWTFNTVRKCTFEYYIVIILATFFVCKCQSLNKESKKLNGMTFARPIYELLLTFRKYILNDISDPKIVFCTETFENFSHLYSTTLKKCFKQFIINTKGFL